MTVVDQNDPSARRPLDPRAIDAASVFLKDTVIAMGLDADVNVHDRDDGWEYAVDVRPAIKLQRRGLHAALDLAYEARFPRGLQPTTQLAADAAIVSIAPMLTFHPTGPSAFDRPELRVIYRAAHQNDGALALYPQADPRARAWTQYLGVEAEWWFNSNSYR